jgi:hypothetical protein
VAARRPPGHGRSQREGEKGEGDEGIHLPHLGLGRAVEAAPRGGTVVVMGLRWWLDVVMRQGNGGVVVVW